jgi:hypothetical protein
MPRAEWQPSFRLAPCVRPAEKGIPSYHQGQVIGKPEVFCFWRNFFQQPKSKVETLSREKKKNTRKWRIEKKKNQVDQVCYPPGLHFSYSRAD